MVHFMCHHTLIGSDEVCVLHQEIYIFVLKPKPIMTKYVTLPFPLEYSFQELKKVSKPYKINMYSKHCLQQSKEAIKGGAAKTRPPATLKCSKVKTCKSRKLKLHQSVYLIR